MINKNYLCLIKGGADSIVFLGETFACFIYDLNELHNEEVEKIITKYKLGVIQGDNFKESYDKIQKAFL